MRAAMQGVAPAHAARGEAFASEAPWAHYRTMPIMRSRKSPTPREARVGDGLCRHVGRTDLETFGKGS